MRIYVQETRQGIYTRRLGVRSVLVSWQRRVTTTRQVSAVTVSSLGGSLVSSLVNSLVSSLVNFLVSSLVNFLVSSLVGSSSLGYRYSFTTIVLKLVGPLGSYTLYISLLILSNLNRLVHLPLCLVLPLYYISTSKLRWRL